MKRDVEVAPDRRPRGEPPVPKRALIADAMEANHGLDQWGGDAEDLTTIYAGYIDTLTKGK